MSNKAIAYCRVSTEGQKIHGFSLSEQKHRIDEYCLKNKLKITYSITETCSGGNNKALLSCLNETSKHIIVCDVTRFSRNINKGLQLIHMLTEKNKIIHFIQENINIDKYDMSSKITDNYINLYKSLEKAAYESEVIGMRISNIKKYKKEMGEYSGGIIPFGLDLYTKTYIDEEGQSRIVKKFKWDEEAKNIIIFIEKCRTPPFTSDEISSLMRKISIYDDPIDLVYIYEYDEVISNKSNEPLDYKDIASLLNEYGVMYKKNKKFTASIIQRIKSIKELESLIVTEDTNRIDRMINNISDLSICTDKKNISNYIPPITKRIKKIKKSFRNNKLMPLMVNKKSLTSVRRSPRFINLGDIYTNNVETRPDNLVTDSKDIFMDESVDDITLVSLNNDDTETKQEIQEKNSKLENEQENTISEIYEEDSKKIKNEHLEYTEFKSDYEEFKEFIKFKNMKKNI